MKAAQKKMLETVVADIKKAMDYMKSDKPARCEKKLDSLVAKLEKKLVGAKDAKPRKPSAYALFVKANYKKVAALNEGSDAPSVMKKLAVLYKEQKAEAVVAAPAPKKKAAAAPKKAKK